MEKISCSSELYMHIRRIQAKYEEVRERIY